MNRLSLAGLLILFLQAAPQIRAAFDGDFGSGDRVSVQCSGSLVSELRINLRGQIDRDTPLSELLSAASRVSSACNGGVIDAAGFGR
ncbi:MAG: hypothetical protein ACRER2_18645 [Methylococcales bacterium]